MDFKNIETNENCEFNVDSAIDQFEITNSEAQKQNSCKTVDTIEKISDFDDKLHDDDCQNDNKCEFFGEFLNFFDENEQNIELSSASAGVIEANENSISDPLLLKSDINFVSKEDLDAFHSKSYSYSSNSESNDSDNSQKLQNTISCFDHSSDHLLLNPVHHENVENLNLQGHEENDQVEIPAPQLQNIDNDVVDSSNPSCSNLVSHQEDIKNLNLQSFQENAKKEIIFPQVQKVDNNFISTIHYYESQLQSMINNNMKMQADISEMRTKLKNQERERDREIEWKATESKLKFELLSKIEMLTKERAALQKDKESMVIRYANSEKEVIIEKKAQCDLEKKMKEISKDRENLSSKVKNLTIEKARLSSIVDSKMVELAKFQRENEKFKEDFTSRDIKIKWLQNKLKTEVSSHKDTQNRLEHNMHRINEMREEAEQVRRDCQEMIKRYQEAEELKSIKLDGQLKQKLSELEVQKQEKSDQEQVYQLLRQELEALKKKQRLTIEENNSLTLKIHSLEKERLEYEQTLSKLKDSQNLLKQEVVDLAAQLAEMDNLQLQLEREKDKSAASLREVDRLRSTNAELQADMDACHLKEGELLEFTKIVTQKTVQLQSDHSILEIRAQALEDENKQLNRQHTDLQAKYLELSQNLKIVEKERQEETHLLARKLAEKTRTVEQLNVKLDEAENENRVMRKRHIASIKELSRELQQCRHKVESYEMSKFAPEESNLGSRASSTASLEVIPSCSPFAVHTTSETEISPSVAFTGGKAAHNSHNKKSTALSSAMSDVVDKRTLIDRIIKLQENIARKEDKIEFLEDHAEQLIKEMKKKTKIIQSYILKEEAGALTSNSSDENKLLLCKRGGIMASVYTSLLSDNNMTLELSLEINQKLQAVLEDTLLKNITLKENVNTLGEEIARLSTEQRQFSKQLKRPKNVK